MKKLLFSFMLMIVFSIPFTTQAEIITAPVYKVDVMQPAESIGLNKVIAVNVVKSANKTRSLSQIKNIDLNIKMTAVNQKPEIIFVGQCASCHSNATNTIGVSGGDSIGIGKPV